MSVGRADKTERTHMNKTTGHMEKPTLEEAALFWALVLNIVF